MKLRNFFFVALAAISLSGCEMIELTTQSYKPGLNGSVESKPKTIAYFDGDNIAKESLTAHELTFIAEEDEVAINKENPSELKQYIVDNENIIKSIDKAEEISTFYHFEENANLGNGLKLGYISDLVNGNLDFTFNCKIKAAEVYGYLRYGLKGYEEGNKIVVDDNSAISANGSRFIKLPYKENIADLEQKVCAFNFANEENILQLCVYGKRAVITKIVVYS